MLRTAQGAFCNLLEMFNGASPYIFISADELFDVMLTDQVVALIQVACGVKTHKIPNFIIINDSTGQNMIRVHAEKDNCLPIFHGCEFCWEHFRENIPGSEPNIPLFRAISQ